MDRKQRMTRQKEQEDNAEKRESKIGKRNQMTALRLLTGGHQTSRACLRGFTQGHTAWSCRQSARFAQGSVVLRCVTLCLNT